MKTRQQRRLNSEFLEHASSGSCRCPVSWLVTRSHTGSTLRRKHSFNSILEGNADFSSQTPSWLLFILEQTRQVIVFFSKSTSCLGGPNCMRCDIKINATAFSSQNYAKRRKIRVSWQFRNFYCKMHIFLKTPIFIILLHGYVLLYFFAFENVISRLFFSCWLRHAEI